jgi:hypothetical protein
MTSFTILSLFLSLQSSIVSARGVQPRGNSPSAFILTGDSTTAALNPGGGGWGNGLLTTTHGGAIGSNHGYDGSTTESYLYTGGLWPDAMEEVTRLASIGFTPYVTIQVCL